MLNKASFLSRLSFSLKAKSEFPFPSNPLYNIFDSDGSTPGFSIPLGFCLVGVVTCSDDRVRPNNHIERMDDGGVFRNALDALGGGRLLVPLPSATTRLLAFRHAFDAVGIMLNESAQTELPEVAAKATWASGGDFLGVAKKLKSKLDVFDTSVATEQDLRSALIAFGRNQFSPASKKATYTADFPSLGTTSGPSMGVSFTSVGGNKDAKLALEDALALDPKKRHLLESFGLQAPTGVLLYGPPGTGKTLCKFLAFLGNGFLVASLLLVVMFLDVIADCLRLCPQTTLCVFFGACLVQCKCVIKYFWDIQGGIVMLHAACCAAA